MNFKNRVHLWQRTSYQSRVWCAIPDWWEMFCIFCFIVRTINELRSLPSRCLFACRVCVSVRIWYQTLWTTRSATCRPVSDTPPSASTGLLCAASLSSAWKVRRHGSGILGLSKTWTILQIQFQIEVFSVFFQIRFLGPPILRYDLYLKNKISILS